jgi:CheY-like chemotaxis protein
MVRVPVLAAHETFLLLEQGELALAVPWHSVVRMRLARADQLDALAAQDGYAVLPALAPMEDDDQEQPVVLLGLGLRRAYLRADRIVWRMPAEPTDETPPRGLGLGPIVRTADGATFAMLDAARLLRDVPLPPLPLTGPREPRPLLEFEPESPTGATGTAPAEPAAAPAPMDAAESIEANADRGEPETPPFDEEEAPPPTSRPLLRLIELGPADVQPLDAAGEAALGLVVPPSAIEPKTFAPEPSIASDVAAAEPLAAGPPATHAAEPVTEPSESRAPKPAATTPAVAPVAAAPMAIEAPAAPDTFARSRAPRRALVAEDSITARIFLVRLLEQVGFEVVAVASGRDLAYRAGREPWTIVLVDVDLPDAAAGSALTAIAPLRADGGAAPVVALVRDADDASQARSRGVSRTLAKPYEREALIELLESLGAPADFGPGARP